MVCNEALYTCFVLTDNELFSVHLAFGFLPGKEILDAGLANAGIRDRK